MNKSGNARTRAIPDFADRNDDYRGLDQTALLMIHKALSAPSLSPFRNCQIINVVVSNHIPPFLATDPAGPVKIIGSNSRRLKFSVGDCTIEKWIAQIGRESFLSLEEPLRQID